MLNLRSWTDVGFKYFFNSICLAKNFRFQYSWHHNREVFFFFSGKTIGFFLLPGCPRHLALCRVQEYINNSQNILKTITVWKIVCMLRIELFLACHIYIVTAIQEEPRPWKGLCFYHFLPHLFFFFFFSPLASKANGHLWLPLLISSWNLSNLSCIFSLNKFCFSFNLLPFVCTIHSISPKQFLLGWLQCEVHKLYSFFFSVWGVSWGVCLCTDVYVHVFMCDVGW